MGLWRDQLLAVARTEWRVTWRGLGVRLVLVLLAAPFIPYLLLPRTNFDDGGLTILTFIAPFGGLLAAFLIVPGPRRERQFRTADLTWVRPLDGLTYVAGKVLAALLVMALVLAELVALVALTQATAGLGVSLHLGVSALLVTAPTLLFCATLYVALGAALPHPLLGYVVALALTFLCSFFLAQSMLVVANPWTIALFYNKVLGFGPDLPLLVANRLLYLGLALALAGAAVLLFGRRERRALAPRRQGRIALAALLGGLVVGGLGLARFGDAAAAVTITGLVTVPPALPLSVTGYTLDARLDPATGDVAGTARFTLRNDGTTPLATLPLVLNDGLHLRVATVGGRPAPVTSSPAFGHVALSPPLRAGQSALVTLAYGGRFKVLHADYGPTSHGLQTSWSFLSPPLHPSYLYSGLALLYRDGDWYPVPWTRATTTVQPPPLGWRSLVLRVPAAGGASVASTPLVRRQGDQRLFTWRLGGRLPSALLAVVPTSYRQVEVSGGVVYAPDRDAGAVRARYGPYARALADLNSYFGQPAGPVTVVAIPLGGLGDGRGYPVAAAVGNTLALVPVGGLDQRLGRTLIRVARLAAPAPYRAALSDLAVAWWADRLSRSEGFPTMIVRGINGTISDLPNGYVSLREQTGYADPTGALPAYSGAAVAGLRLGAASYAREMALRRSLAAIMSRQPQATTDQALYDVEYLGLGPLAARIQALGLMRRITSFTTDTSPALDDLRRAVGAARLRHVVSALAAAGTTPYDAPSVACALSRATGQPVSAWMNRYVPPFWRSFIQTTPVGGCR